MKTWLLPASTVIDMSLRKHCRNVSRSPVRQSHPWVPSSISLEGAAALGAAFLFILRAGFRLAVLLGAAGAALTSFLPARRVLGRDRASSGAAGWGRQLPSSGAQSPPAPRSAATSLKDMAGFKSCHSAAF